MVVHLKPFLKDSRGRDLVIPTDYVSHGTTDWKQFHRSNSIALGYAIYGNEGHSYHLRLGLLQSAPSRPGLYLGRATVYCVEEDRTISAVTLETGPPWLPNPAQGSDGYVIRKLLSDHEPEGYIVDTRRMCYKLLTGFFSLLAAYGINPRDPSTASVIPKLFQLGFIPVDLPARLEVDQLEPIPSGELNAMLHIKGGMDRFQALKARMVSIQTSVEQDFSLVDSFLALEEPLPPPVHVGGKPLAAAMVQPRHFAGFMSKVLGHCLDLGYKADDAYCIMSTTELACGSLILVDVYKDRRALGPFSLNPDGFMVSIRTTCCSSLLTKEEWLKLHQPSPLGVPPDDYFIMVTEDRGLQLTICNVDRFTANMVLAYVQEVPPDKPRVRGDALASGACLCQP